MDSISKGSGSKQISKKDSYHPQMVERYCRTEQDLFFPLTPGITERTVGLNK